MGTQFITSKIEDGVATVTINHPPANSLNSAVMGELEQTFKDLDANDQAKVVVFTGGGTTTLA